MTPSADARPAAHTAPPWSGPPASFDDFDIVRALGAGGMGTVYVAHDRRLDRHVAIKFLTSTGSDPQGRARFSGEAHALARLQHPNIVSLYDVGDLHGRPYLVCELIVGRRLDEFRFPVAWPEALQIGVGLARAVVATHERGVLHRDIKPSNVMVGHDGVIKLLDFGLAVVSDDPLSSGGSVAVPPLRLGRITETGVVVGTPRYMAPELWSGVLATPRTDLFAFGLVLHELVFGKVPEEGDRQVIDGLPPGFARVIDDCVQRLPGERPASAAQVCDELERLASPPSGASARPRARPAAVPAPPALGAPVSSEITRRIRSSAYQLAAGTPRDPPWPPAEPAEPASGESTRGAAAVEQPAGTPASKEAP